MVAIIAPEEGTGNILGDQSPTITTPTISGEPVERLDVRASLAKDPGFEGYPKGSIIVCGDCWKPVYKLERGITPGDRCGRAASAFAPLTRVDFADLNERPDLDLGWRGLLAIYAMSPDVSAVLDADRPRSGDMALCPACGGQFLKARAVTLGETLDRAYVWEMLWVPPLATPGANPFIGRATRWLDTSDDDLVVV